MVESISTLLVTSLAGKHDLVSSAAIWTAHTTGIAHALCLIVTCLPSMDETVSSRTHQALLMMIYAWLPELASGVIHLGHGMEPH